MTPIFDKKTQLKLLLERYPDDPVEIRGVILDFAGETGEGLEKILDHSRVRRNIFLDSANQSSARMLVATLARNREERQRLLKECERVYPEIPEILSTLASTSPKDGGFLPHGRLDPPATLAGHDVEAVIWQLSDVHFGKFNRLENDPYELASILANVVATSKDYRPDIIIMSGDVSSIAAKEEFESFLVFSKALSKHLWKKEKPGRFLVLPGNHDTTWRSDGRADRMSAFREVFKGKLPFITPFSEAQALEGGDIRVEVDHEDIDRVPPLVRLTYDRYQLELLLVVSGYYTGEVPEATRNLIAAIPSKASIMNLLREDHGDIGVESILRIRNLPRSDLTRIAITHHNLCAFGMIPCQVRHAQELLEALGSQQFVLTFHGHTHLVEDVTSRPVIAGSAYPVPCTTLTSETTVKGKGFSIHLLGPPAPKRRVTTLVWEMAEAGFRAADVVIGYRFVIENGRIRVEHDTHAVGRR